MRIEELRCKCHDETLFLTDHALKQCRQRNILIDDIKSCILHGEIIEDYPNDYPYPSALIFEMQRQEPLHVVAGLSKDLLWIITAYHPDVDKWTNGFKTRKEGV